MSNEQTPPDEILTEAQLAARLSVQRETLSRYRRDLQLPHIKLGDGPKPRVRYVWADVVAWLQARRSPEIAPARKRGRPRNVDRGPGRDGGPW